MSIRCQTGNAVWASRYQGLGATGAAIKALPMGTHGMGIGDNDGLADSAEYFFRVSTPPATGSLRLYELGNFAQVIVSDGPSPWAYRIYENGVVQASGAEISVGVLVGAPAAPVVFGPRQLYVGEVMRGVT